MDTSYRKRFRWQKADKELTSIHVVIKRRSLVNPIKSSAPLNRLFDPERHNLIVHLHMKNTSSGSNGEVRRSIFDREDVVCNKEDTPPDRWSMADTGRQQRQQKQTQSHTLQQHHSLNRDAKKRCCIDTSYSGQSSDSSEVGSPQIYRKNFDRKYCRDLLLQDELKKRRSVKHNSKNQSSKESAGIENRPSTSGYNNRCTDQEGGGGSNRLHSSKSSRSITPQSETGSVDRPSEVHYRQKISEQIVATELKLKEKEERFKPVKHNYLSDNEDPSSRGTASYFTCDNNKNKSKEEEKEDGYDVRQDGPSPRQAQSTRTSRSRSTHRPAAVARSTSRSSRSRSRSTVSSDARRYHHHDRNNRSVHRTISSKPKTTKISLRGSTRSTTSRSRSRDNRKKSKQEQEEVYDVHQGLSRSRSRHRSAVDRSRSIESSTTVSYYNRSSNIRSSAVHLRTKSKSKTIRRLYRSTRSRSRSRSLTPLRPGEYRPPEALKRLRGAATDGRQQQRDRHRGPPFDGRRMVFGPRAHAHLPLGPTEGSGGGGGSGYPVGSRLPPQPMLAGPYIQYMVPVMTHHHPHGGPQGALPLPPSFLPMPGGYQAMTMAPPPPRPPKVYNHRHIPSTHFSKSAAGAVNTKAAPAPTPATPSAINTAPLSQPESTTITATLTPTVTEPRKHAFAYTDIFMMDHDECAANNEPNVANVAAK